jgi:hypothetical protein
MGYLSFLHIYRLIYDYGNYTLDISGYAVIFKKCFIKFKQFLVFKL